MELGEQIRNIIKTLGYIEKKQDTMMGRQEKIAGEVDMLMHGQEKISTYVIGDKDNALNGGALQEIAHLKAKIAKFEKLVIKIAGIVIGLSLAAGWGLASIIETVTKVLKK